MAFFIRFSAAPVGAVGPLLPRLHEGNGILTLQVGLVRAQPLGLNVDAVVIFDMQSDGGVDWIEILHRQPSHLRPATVWARPRERYWRMFLEPSSKETVERDAEVTIDRSGLTVTYRFDEGDPDARYLVGPGAEALVAAGNRLIGISVDLTPFAP